jgi:hypothetical protein
MMDALLTGAAGLVLLAVLWHRAAPAVRAQRRETKNATERQGSMAPGGRLAPVVFPVTRTEGSSHEIVPEARGERVPGGGDA